MYKKKFEQMIDDCNEKDLKIKELRESIDVLKKEIEQSKTQNIYDDFDKFS